MKSIRYNKSAIPYAYVNSWHICQLQFIQLLSRYQVETLSISSEVGEYIKESPSESGMIIWLGVQSHIGNTVLAFSRIRD